MTIGSMRPLECYNMATRASEPLASERAVHRPRFDPETEERLERALTDFARALARYEAFRDHREVSDVVSPTDEAGGLKDGVNTRICLSK
jgi:hypothetical protein